MNQKRNPQNPSHHPEMTFKPVQFWRSPKSTKNVKIQNCRPKKIGVRDTLTGYVVPGHVGDGTWMAWENSSAVAVAVAVAVLVAHLGPIFRPFPQVLHIFRPKSQFLVNFSISLPVLGLPVLAYLFSAYLFSPTCSRLPVLAYLFSPTYSHLPILNYLFSDPL